MTEKLEHVGVTIRRGRRHADLTQGELAELVGMTRVSISNMERGYSEPLAENVTKIFDALGISMANTAVAIDAARTERGRCMDACFKQADVNLKSAERSSNEHMCMLYMTLASECSLLGFIISSLPDNDV